MVVWVALSLAAIIGMVALAMDGGRLMTERQHAQAIADAAALAAAGVLYQEYPINGGMDMQGNARAAALQTAAANGITDGAKAVVTVNIPPTEGDFTGRPGYAEVIVSNRLSVSFSVIFGYTQLTVSARATARGVMSGTPAVSGFYVLASTGKDAFQAASSTELTITNAPLHVNSADDKAIKTTGGCSITASAFYFVGDGYKMGAFNGPITHPAPPAADPLAALPPPDYSAFPVKSPSALTVNRTVTLQPGVYIGGITVTGGKVTLEPGVYLMNGGGFKINGGAVIGSAVMIYNGADSSHTAGAIAIDESDPVTLSPPTSGIYTGVTFFQDRLVNQPVQIQASHNKNITGAIYAPAAPMDLSGASDNKGTMDVLGGPIICLTTEVKGLFHVSTGVGRSATPRHLYGLVD
jgi:Flp pilus assembly protein TadG